MLRARLKSILAKIAFPASIAAMIVAEFVNAKRCVTKKRSLNGR
jgi:hypothetical protein